MKQSQTSRQSMYRESFLVRAKENQAKTASNDLMGLENTFGVVPRSDHSSTEYIETRMTEAPSIVRMTEDNSASHILTQSNPQMLDSVVEEQENEDPLLESIQTAHFLNARSDSKDYSLGNSSFKLGSSLNKSAEAAF